MGDTIESLTQLLHEERYLKLELREQVDGLKKRIDYLVNQNWSQEETIRRLAKENAELRAILSPGVGQR